MATAASTVAASYASIKSLVATQSPATTPDAHSQPAALHAPPPHLTASHSSSRRRPIQIVALSSNSSHNRSRSVSFGDSGWLRKAALTGAGLAAGSGIGCVLMRQDGLDILNSLIGGGGGGGKGRGGGKRNWWEWDAAVAAEDDEESESEDEESDDEEESDEEEEDEEEEEEEEEGDAKAKEVAGKKEAEEKAKKEKEKKAAAAAVKAEEFDPHGMRAGTRVAVDKLSTTKRYRVADVDLVDQRSDRVIPKADGFYEMVSVGKGTVCTRAQLEAEVANMASSGMFQMVEADTVANPDGSIKLEVKVLEAQWQAAKTVRCVNMGLVQPDASGQEASEDAAKQEAAYAERLRQARQCLLPRKVENELSAMVQREGRLTARMLQKIRDRILKWYHDKGYACANVINFGNLNTPDIVCEVVEGDVTGVEVQFLDKMGQRCEGITDERVVMRELPIEIKPGNVFNIEAGRKALQSISSLQLFANMEVNPRPDDQLEGGIVMEVKVREQEPTSAEVQTEWSIQPGDTGKPTVSILPGGSVSFEHRNINGLNRSVTGSVSAGNLLSPQDDLVFKLEYVHPYIDGVDDTSRNRVGRVTCFNHRKVSAVFTGGPSLDEVPAIWVDRAGIKATVSENFTRQSRITYGAVIEEVTTRDENTSICTHGFKMLPSGLPTPDGPPTTLSGTGVDRVAFLQANVTRDNTNFVNGTPVGDRTIFQVDQGLGIGSAFPFFNRHQLTHTRFMQLSEEDVDHADRPPMVGVLHARYGGCMGDLPSYEAYALGGPYSVRGYNMGEIGAARRFLELAGEIRVPVKTTHAYAFAEMASDLGSSGMVSGNPTEFFRRAGFGASVGAGVRLGTVRAEYARDCNMGTGSWFVRFGERF